MTDLEKWRALIARWNPRTDWPEGGDPDVIDAFIFLEDACKQIDKLNGMVERELYAEVCGQRNEALARIAKLRKALVYIIRPYVGCGCVPIETCRCSETPKEILQEVAANALETDDANT